MAAVANSSGAHSSADDEEGQLQAGPEFHGHPTLRLGNAYLSVDVLAAAGPRIVRLLLAGGSDNLLAETPHVGWDTPFGRFQLRGGHRLWHAPEHFPRTYAPDNGPIEVTSTSSGAVLRQPVEAPTGLSKTIEIRIDPGRAALSIVHTIGNASLWPIALAPWAITQLPLGGIALLPVQAPSRGSHAPNRQLNLWPYSEWDDPRLRFGPNCVVIHGEARMPPLKLGYLNHRGWLAYLCGDVLLCKRWTPLPDREHADLNSNAEVFCHDEFVELESLAPLTTLEPGAEVSHQERWEIAAPVAMPQNDDDLLRLIHSIER